MPSCADILIVLAINLTIFSSSMYTWQETSRKFVMGDGMKWQKLYNFLDFLTCTHCHKFLQISCSFVIQYSILYFLLNYYSYKE